MRVRRERNFVFFWMLAIHERSPGAISARGAVDDAIQSELAKHLKKELNAAGFYFDPYS